MATEPVDQNKLFKLATADDEELRESLEEFTTEQLKFGLDLLGGPIKLTVGQRMLAGAFGIDVPKEVRRFSKMIQEVLDSRPVEYNR